MQKSLMQNEGVKSVFERNGKYEERNIFDGSVKVLFFGKFDHLDHVMGWVLRKLQTQEDLENPENKNVVELLLEIAKKYNFKKIFAPVANPHNGRIMSQDDKFKHKIILNKKEVENGAESIYLYRGANFEGLKIEEGEAFYLPSADCLTVILQDEFGNLVTFHAGRESLHNNTDPFKENPFKQAIKNLKGDTKKMKVWMGYGIAPESFIHPLKGDEKYVEGNRQRFAQVRYLYNDFRDYPENEIMGQDGGINIFNLAKKQAEESGLSIENIQTDEADTFTDSRIFSNRRGESGRNGIFVFKNI